MPLLMNTTVYNFKKTLKLNKCLYFVREVCVFFIYEKLSLDLKFKSCFIDGIEIELIIYIYII